MDKDKMCSEMVDKIIKLEALNRRLKDRNEFLHKLAADKVEKPKPNLWIVIISRNGERFNAEFNDEKQANDVYNAEVQTGSPAVLYECVAKKTFVPLDLMSGN